MFYELVFYDPANKCSCRTHVLTRLARVDSLSRTCAREATRACRRVKQPAYVRAQGNTRESRAYPLARAGARSLQSEVYNRLVTKFIVRPAQKHEKCEFSHEFLMNFASFENWFLCKLASIKHAIRPAKDYKNGRLEHLSH